ncbi:cytochrome P450 [Iodidimonas sp. SYSU 1G8]|uniref:cytochrome P450 n=1 Tax=Iodidimonas sp. SYSU 1G8 TaxID=3133967 RepID=UPI0031FEB343
MNKALGEFNFFSPEVMKSPFEFYKKAREEAPVYKMPGAEVYFITQYADVKLVARKPKIFSSEFDRLMQPAAPDPRVAEVLAKGYPGVATMLTRDAPAHNRYRALVNPAFSEKRVRELRPHMEEIVHHLMAQLPQSGTVDFFDKVAVPLPVWVIADALGVSRDDLPKFKHWSDCAVARFSLVTTPEQDIYIAEQVVEFQHYFVERIEERRLNPADDVVSALVHARIEGERPLDIPEMLSIIQQILVAGNETTTATLAAGMVHLVRRPDVLERLRADRSLIGQFIEEILRLESPSAGMWRVTLEDTEVHGVQIPAGSKLLIRWDSANRDETVFEDAETLDLDRKNSMEHLAFGYGIHMCLGHVLARQELMVAFNIILDELKSWKLAEGHEELVYVPNALLHGLGELHLEIEKF